MASTSARAFASTAVGRYTEGELRFTGDEFLPPTFAGVPRSAQGTQDVKQFFTRGEAVWTGFDGRFTNYFGVNYTDHRSEQQTDAGALPTITPADRTKVDWRGVTLLMPGQTLVTGARTRNREHGDRRGSTRDNTNTAGYVELQSQFAQRFFVVAQRPP